MTSKFSQGDHVYLLDVNNPSLPHKRRGIRDYYSSEEQISLLSDWIDAKKCLPRLPSMKGLEFSVSKD
jgi:hypothetical protein